MNITLEVEDFFIYWRISITSSSSDKGEWPRHDRARALPFLEGAAKTARELFDANSPNIAAAE